MMRAQSLKKETDSTPFIIIVPIADATKRAGSTTGDSRKKRRTTPSPPSSSTPTREVLKIRSANKPYTKRELKIRDDNWNRRYQELLKAARDGDAHAMLVLPDFKEYKLAMACDFKETAFKVECLDIYHYLRARLGESKVSHAKFGPLIGVDLKRSTLGGWLKNEEKLREMAPLLPDGAKRISSTKNSKVEGEHQELQEYTTRSKYRVQ